MADKKGQKLLLDGSAVPFRGGVDTLQENALLPIGKFSTLQNMRQRHSGVEQRAGMARQHSATDSGAKTLSLYQFSKGKTTERHFFAQMADGDILESTDAPPTATAGAFGAEVYSGSAGQGAASWSDIDDIMVLSNGVDQHQLYAGTANPVLAFIRHDDAVAISDMPSTYIDYTRQVTDGDASTTADISSLDVIANDECLYIATPIPANRLTFTVLPVNGNVAVGTLKYWKSDGSWADTTETDGTATSGKTMGKTGSMTWTSPADEIPKFLFGINAYWYQWEVATQLDADVEISAVTYGSGFTSLTNVWNGRKDYIIEAVIDDNSASIISNFSGDNITLDEMEFDNDTLWIASYYPLQGIYIDVGGSPNTATTSTIKQVDYWNGGAFADASETDHTSGLEYSGWITWPRIAFGTEQRTRINGSSIYAYWYKIQIGVATTSVMNISIEGMPHYDITDFGKGGTSCVWKDRMSYSFDKYPNYLYISEMYRPNVLNGDDYAIMEVGDGRANPIVCQKRFHNELMVWQKEQGKDGGCLTIFEGYSPETFGKLVLSTKVGTFNPKSAVVVDGVLTSGETGDKIRTEAYFISHNGICMTDGLTVSIVSDEIQNYFDPSFTECIRRGYESEMWVEHDTAYNVLRFGLVSGTSATTCNIFPVLDLTDKTWSFDTLGSNLSCMTEVEAASGNTSILQYGGGVSDGFIYRLNTGTNDIVGANPTTTAISSSVTIEISIKNYILQLRRLVLRMKAQTAGDCTVTLYRRGVAASSTLTLTMLADITGDTSRRHDVGIKSLKGDQLSINFANAVASQSLYLLDFGLEISKVGDR